MARIAGFRLSDIRSPDRRNPISESDSVTEPGALCWSADKLRKHGDNAASESMDATFIVRGSRIAEDGDLDGRRALAGFTPGHGVSASFIGSREASGALGYV